MSNVIPPLLSDTPPPPPDVEDHEDDEFGDFTGRSNLSYDYDDSFSPPGSPLQLPPVRFELDYPVPTEIFDINSNSKDSLAENAAQLDKSKDFCDKRKDLNFKVAGVTVNSSVDRQSISDEIPGNNIDEEYPISSNNTAPPLENPKLFDNIQDLTELKSNGETKEIIATNCDTKTTSSEKENSSLSSKAEELFSKNIESPKVEESNIRSISNTSDQFSDLASVTVNNPSKGANYNTNELELAVDDNNDDIELPKQCEKLGNNGAIEICQDIDQIEAESLTLSVQESNGSGIRLQVESGHNNQELKYDESELLSAEKSMLNIEECNIESLSTITQSSPSELYHEVINHSVESVNENSFGLSNEDFGAFIDNTRDKKVLNTTNDGFGDFSSSSNIKQFDSLNDNVSNRKGEVEFDGFGDFTSVQRSVSNSTFQPSAKNIDEVPSNIDYNFGAFTTPKQSNNDADDQAFEDFANFSPVPQSTDQDNFGDDDDDFGDFATTSVSPAQAGPSGSDQYSKIILLNEKQALNKSMDIVKEMFPVVEKAACDFEYKGLEADDKIFNQIKNITDTHALSFQWPKSASQNLLLKSLNIDSRNILYGPGWNPSMPRFAANLSITPLEPVKSEILTPTPTRETNLSSQTTNVERPQFDLSEMDLPAPLDFSAQSVLLDLEQLVAQLEAPSFKNPSSHNSSSPANEFENWEAWLESIPTKVLTNSADTSDTLGGKRKDPEPSVKLSSTSLPPNINQKVAPIIVHDDFDDFVSYSSPTIHEAPHGHNIILRETHISNKESSKNDESDIVSWLEPTIVTPELIRKERPFVEPDEEFDDFQMVIAPEDQSNKPIETPTSLTVKPLKAPQPKSVIKHQNDTLHATTHFDFVERTLKEPASIKATGNDDFGDFTFSLPNEGGKSHAAPPVPAQPIQPLTPVQLLEPLKPSVVQGQNAASISWPDPGITDDEISRFEALGYARVQSKTLPELNEQHLSSIQGHERKGSIDAKVINSTKPPKTTQKSKQSSLDDDEWSEFVSGQNTSPIHKLKAEKDRSSTPDLPLSVLNLGSVQPAKQPIPVITQNGLVQTKLPSNMSLNFPNMMQQTNRVYPQPPVQNNAAYQPSIISNQYASQAYGGFASYGHYQGPSVSNSASKANGDDDEWSDFVSHQPAAPKTSQSRVSQGWASQPHQLSSWMSNATPNITTNPAAGFNVFSGSGVQKQAKKVPGPAQSKRSAGVSSVSIPDLDFLAPRNRTTQRK